MNALISSARTRSQSFPDRGDADGLHLEVSTGHIVFLDKLTLWSITGSATRFSPTHRSCRPRLRSLAV